MSYHVYLARAGWKTTPITVEEWRSAATSVAALDVSVRKPDGGLVVHLTGQRRQWLAWQDGFVYAQNPDEKLVEVMFLLAERLGAQVYSEREVPYRDVDDWRRRTQPYRERREAGALEARRANRRKMAWILLAVVLGLLAGWWFD